MKILITDIHAFDRLMAGACRSYKPLRLRLNLALICKLRTEIRAQSLQIGNEHLKSR